MNRYHLFWDHRLANPMQPTTVLRMVPYLFEFQPAVRNNILSRIQVDVLVHRAEGATDRKSAAITVCVTKRRSHDALCARGSDSIGRVLARVNLIVGLRFRHSQIWRNEQEQKWMKWFLRSAKDWISFVTMNLDGRFRTRIITWGSEGFRTGGKWILEVKDCQSRIPRQYS
jgi:hypothetical protein